MSERHTSAPETGEPAEFQLCQHPDLVRQDHGAGTTPQSLPADAVEAASRAMCIIQKGHVIEDGRVLIPYGNLRQLAYWLSLWRKGDGWNKWPNGGSVP